MMKIEKILVPLAVLAAFGGCDKGEPEPTGDPYDRPYARVEDPAYKKALAASLDERKALMTEAAKVAEALEAERAKDPESPKIAELEAQRQAVSRKMMDQRIKTQALVRDRINKEQQAIKAREEKENLKKGNN